MKSKKLSLNELKVKSFTTDFEKGISNTVKGGSRGCPITQHLFGCGNQVSFAGTYCPGTDDCQTPTRNDESFCICL